MKNTELLTNAFKECLGEIEPTRGGWTIDGIMEASVNVGKVELKSGKEALVRLVILNDEDFIANECDDFDDLPYLDRKEQ